jgi:hypothetical protein
MAVGEEVPFPPEGEFALIRQATSASTNKAAIPARAIKRRSGLAEVFGWFEGKPDWSAMIDTPKKVFQF